MNSKGMTEITITDKVEKLSIWFERFGEQASGSKLYGFLSNRISKDEELLKIISRIQSKQPIPNLFLAAINFLLNNEEEAELRNFYPRYGGGQDDLEKTFDVFRKFVITNEDRVISICNERIVQTNEVRRSALFAAAISKVCNDLEIEKVHLLELGASGGLNLLFDQYNISYSNGSQLGNLDSDFSIECEIRGSSNFASSKLPRIGKRYGLDLNPLDLSEESDQNWGKSLIWPDQLDRLENFNRAISVLDKNRVDIQKASTPEALRNFLEAASLGEDTLCYMHSFTYNQMPQEIRDEFERVLEASSTRGDILEFGIEWLDTDTPEINFINYKNGEKKQQMTIARCDQHGKWIEFI